MNTSFESTLEFRAKRQLFMAKEIYLRSLPRYDFPHRVVVDCLEHHTHPEKWEMLNPAIIIERLFYEFDQN